MEKTCEKCNGKFYIWIDWKQFLCLNCGGRGSIIFCEKCGRAGISFIGKLRICLGCGKEI